MNNKLGNRVFPIINREIRVVSRSWKHPRYENLKGKTVYDQLSMEDIEKLQLPKHDVGYYVYETTSLGTPLTPVCGDVDELLQYAAENGVPVVGDRWKADQSEWKSLLETNND